MIGTSGLEKAADMIGIGEWSEHCQGFLFGMVFILIILILIWLLRVIAARKRKFKGVKIDGPAGNLYISLNAIRQFIHRIMGEFDEVTLSSVTVREARGQVAFSIELEVAPSIELVPLRDQIQKRVLEDAEKRLGLDIPVTVDMDIRSIQPSGKRVTRSERKKMARLNDKNEPKELQTEPENGEPEEEKQPENPLDEDRGNLDTSTWGQQEESESSGEEDGSDEEEEKRDQ